MIPIPMQAVLLGPLDQTLFQNLNVATLNLIHLHPQYSKVDIPTAQPT
jgi:hypothetical protein